MRPTGCCAASAAARDGPVVTARILLSPRSGAVRIALVIDGTLTDYVLWFPGSPDGVGDLHSGRVTARAKAMGGVFVEIGGEEGFLPDGAGGGGLSDGDAVAVRVTRAAHGDHSGGGQGGGRKGKRLAVAKGTAPGPRPGLIERGPGPLADLLAHAPDAELRADDYALIADLRGRFPRIDHDKDAFAGIEDEVAGLAEPVFPLPMGARASVSPTPALTAIDVDAGAATADRAGKAASQAWLNRAAIPELARQIRLRSLGGAILIDFAGMRPSARASLGPDLASALAGDPAKPRLIGFTALGFAEILRPRLRAPLHDLLERARP